MKYAGMAGQMAGAIFLGVFIGQYLDSYFETPKAYWTALCATVGLFAVLYLIFKDILSDEKKS